MKRLSFVLWCMLLSQSISVHAQKAEDCQVLFQKATDKVKSLRLISKKNAFEMVAHVTVTPEKGAVVQERMEIVVLGDKYKYLTSQYSLYQDGKTLVVIQADQKSIFLTRPAAEQQKNQFAEMMKLQDSLQQYLVFRDCTREFGTVQANAGFTKIVYVPTKKLEGLGMKSISYWISAEADVKKIAVDYTPGSVYGMKRYEMVIEKMNARSTTVPFDGEALAQAMRKGVLKGELKGYQVIDKRN